MTDDEKSAALSGVAVDRIVMPFRVEYAGMAGIVWAASAGKARYCAAMSAADAGWMRKANPAEIACRRAPEFDHIATAEAGKCYGLDYVPAA